MEPRLQRRVQRYGWDLAAADYEPLWQAQIAPAQAQLLTCAALAPGERVLDVACGTGLVSFAAAQAVGATGEVVGVDLSGRMVETARARATERVFANTRFAQMDAEQLDFADAAFDVVLCALGLMYFPAPEQALREMQRVLRPGGRVVLAVWGERSRCGWAPVFPIVDAEVVSDVCPLFFSLGQGDTLARLCIGERLTQVTQHRLMATLDYADARTACDAAFVGGPVALAWAHFDAAARARACRRYIEAISSCRNGDGYRLPGEFVIVSAATQSGLGAS